MSIIGKVFTVGKVSTLGKVSNCSKESMAVSIFCTGGKLLQGMLLLRDTAVERYLLYGILL